jgi:glycolate oxidase
MGRIAMPNSIQAVEKLRNIFGPEALVVDPGDLETYSHDEFASGNIGLLPIAVVKPAQEKEILALLRFCLDEGIPITARGGGTGLAGSCVPAPGGIVLAFERMNGIIDLDRKNHTITVWAGTPMSAVFEEAKKVNLFFPPHPGSESACAGGVVATNAGGSRAVKYGTVKRFITGIRVILADGRVLDLGGKIRKSSMGYNLLDLLIGSEGTLGIITQVTFSLLPLPGCMLTLVAPFQTIPEAVAAVDAFLNEGIIPCAVEFIEHAAIRCSERLLNKSWPVKRGIASLMIVLDGASEEEVLREAEQISETLEQTGAQDVLLAEHETKQAEILEIRSMIYEALRPGTIELFDVSVPRSEISPHVHLVHEVERSCGLPLPTYGHAADGNIHTQSMKLSIQDGLLGEEVPDWQRKHKEVRTRIYSDAIKRGGVISGEHGIGLAKRDYLSNSIGTASVEVMRCIKRVLDPRGVLNPGKIFEIEKKA